MKKDDQVKYHLQILSLLLDPEENSHKDSAKVSLLESSATAGVSIYLLHILDLSADPLIDLIQQEFSKLSPKKVEFNQSSQHHSITWPRFLIILSSPAAPKPDQDPLFSLITQFPYSISFVTCFITSLLGLT